MALTEKIVRLHAVDGAIFASSRDVAEDFGKRHDDVLKATAVAREKLPAVLRTAWFRDDIYFGRDNTRRPCIDMTRQGWSLIVMGFTGDQAMAWKVAYILKFDEMEDKLGSGARTDALFDRTQRDNVSAFHGPPSSQRDLFAPPPTPSEPECDDEPRAHNAFKRDTWTDAEDGSDFVIIEDRDADGNVSDLKLRREPPLPTPYMPPFQVPWIVGSEWRHIHLHVDPFIPFAVVTRAYLNRLPDGFLKDTARATLYQFLAL